MCVQQTPPHNLRIQFNTSELFQGNTLTSKTRFKMKIKSNGDVHVASDLKQNTMSLCEEAFAKLIIGDKPSEPLENQLKLLSLNDGADERKLIERAPIKSKDAKTKITPYCNQAQQVGQYVSYTHNCGATFIQTTELIRQTNQSKHHSDVAPINCPDLFGCDSCKLKIANSNEFLDFLCINLHNKQDNSTQVQNSPEDINNQPTEPTDTPINDSLFLVPPPRRLSDDSGFQSDNPSPLSESVLSPMPYKSKPEVTRKTFRKILPKTTEMGGKMSETNDSLKHSSVKQKEVEGKSAKELLRSTLHPEEKLKEWIDVSVNKTDEEVFGVDETGRTILHTLLESDRQHLPESFYSLVEKMKRNPDKCSHITAAQSSICDLLKQKHLQLLLDYFQEALHIIRNEIKNKSTN